MIKKSTVFIATLFTTYVVPVALRAIEYVPLSPELPLSSGSSNWLAGGMTGFINKLFAISVAVAAILAVIMLAIGGFKYMTSESVFKMGGAKEQITNAIVGLLIVLAAIVILETINPEITNLNLFASTIYTLC